jgi:hypothetical protein
MAVKMGDGFAEKFHPDLLALHYKLMFGLRHEL